MTAISVCKLCEAILVAPSPVRQTVHEVEESSLEQNDFCSKACENLYEKVQKRKKESKESRPNVFVIFPPMNENQAQEIVAVSKKFPPAFQITNYFKCGHCSSEIFAVEYIEDCPNCENFLWVDSEHKNC